MINCNVGAINIKSFRTFYNIYYHKIALFGGWGGGHAKETMVLVFPSLCSASLAKGLTK